MGSCSQCASLPATTFQKLTSFPTWSTRDSMQRPPRLEDNEIGDSSSSNQWRFGNRQVLSCSFLLGLASYAYCRQPRTVYTMQRGTPCDVCALGLVHLRRVELPLRVSEMLVEDWQDKRSDNDPSGATRGQLYQPPCLFSGVGITSLSITFNLRLYLPLTGTPQYT